MPIRPKSRPNRPRTAAYRKTCNSALPNVFGPARGFNPQRLSSLPPAVDVNEAGFPRRKQLALANARSAPTHGHTLLLRPNQRPFGVTGTGNKVEDFGVGFFTKYGARRAWTSARLPACSKQKFTPLAEALVCKRTIRQSHAHRRPVVTERTDEQQMGAKRPRIGMGDERVLRQSAARSVQRPRARSAGNLAPACTAPCSIRLTRFRCANLSPDLLASGAVVLDGGFNFTAPRPSEYKSFKRACVCFGLRQHKSRGFSARLKSKHRHFVAAARGQFGSRAKPTLHSLMSKAV